MSLLRMKRALRPSSSGSLKKLDPADPGYGLHPEDARQTKTMLEQGEIISTERKNIGGSMNTRDSYSTTVSIPIRSWSFSVYGVLAFAFGVLAFAFVPLYFVARLVRRRGLN